MIIDTDATVKNKLKKKKKKLTQFQAAAFHEI